MFSTRAALWNQEHIPNSWSVAESMRPHGLRRCGRLTMPEFSWLLETSPAFRLMIATSWLAPEAWRENQERAIQQALGGAPDWAEYLRLVERHRTPALSWAALKRVPGLDLPEQVKKELHQRSDDCRM